MERINTYVHSILGLDKSVEIIDVEQQTSTDYLLTLKGNPAKIRPWLRSKFNLNRHGKNTYKKGAWYKGLSDKELDKKTDELFKIK